MRTHFPFVIATLFFGAVAQAANVAVTNTNDNLAGSLRQAIQDASPGDTIIFQIPTSSPGYDLNTGIYTIGLTSGELVINKNLTIDPAGQKIWVQRNSGSFRIFNVTSGQVTILALTIRNGLPSATTVNGGGILNAGNLTVKNCTFTGNNGDSGGSGGAIRNNGTLRVSNCTFSGNQAGLSGTAISNGGDMTLENSTIVGNVAPALSSDGAAVFGGGPATRVRNTIIVGNTRGSTPRDVSGTFTSEGYNLIGSSVAGTTGFGSTGDQLGATPAAANLFPPQDNGGPTWTQRPRPGSVAIDQGSRGVDSNNQPINIDQRGYPRPIDLPGVPNAVGGDGSDIGAVEVAPLQSGPTFMVTNAADHPLAEEGCTTDDCTFLEALGAANANADTNTITFAAGVGPTIVNLIRNAGYEITAPVNIVGPGARHLAISSPNWRILNVTSPNVTISGLTLRNGQQVGTSPGMDGGAIRNSGGLTLIDCTVKDSTACSCGSGVPASGGGLYNASGATATLVRCTFSGNSADGFGGGAIFNAGTLTATNCTFYQNTAPNGGAILSVSSNGASLTTLRNCTITNNTATSTSASTSGGGGYYGEGAVGNSLHHFSNTILAGNINAVNPDLRGHGTSEGNNLIGNLGQLGSGFSDGVNADKVGANPDFGAFGNNGGPTDTIPILANSAARNSGNDNLAPPTDQRGFGRNAVSDIGAFEFAGLLPVTLANVSTRLRVETGDNVLIGGFIITGVQPKKVIIRAIGPSLNLAGQLDNPTLELYQGSTLLASNDDWQNQPAADRQAVVDSTIPPANDLESALVRTLPANGTGYTAIVRGANGGTGIGVVEAYDLDRTVDSKLANISTRGLVQTGDNVLIAGTIVLGSTTQKVIVRAIGPSLPIAGRLENPTLELRDQNGGLLESNDNWGDSPNKQAIVDSTIPPSNNLESAIVRTLAPANYTAIVQGVNDTTGIAVVEVYALD